MKTNKTIFFVVALSCLLVGFNNRSLKTDHDKIALAVYEVRLTHTGYTSFAGTPTDCSIRSNGKVVLTGILSGNENVDAEDDILYTGNLQLTIDIDICSARRLANGEDALCSMTVKGSGPVHTELEIYSDGENNARGGYIKIKSDTVHIGRFTKNVSGTCDFRQIAEEKEIVPDGTIAAIFNGRELPMLTDRTLRVGKKYIERDGVNETVVEVIRAAK